MRRRLLDEHLLLPRLLGTLDHEVRRGRRNHDHQHREDHRRPAHGPQRPVVARPGLK